MKKLLALLICALPFSLYGGTVSGTLQGPSGLPVKNATLTFTLAQAGLIIGSGNVAQLTSQCATSSDGSVVSLPNPTVAPTVTPGGASSLPSGIYYVQFTYYNGVQESAPSPEATIQTTFLATLNVPAPASFPTGAAGMKVYIGTTSGGETLQGTTSSQTAAYVQSAPLVAGATPPVANSSICSIAFNDTIIPYTGYKVALTSSSGNAYPGWPQSWQLNGGQSGTVNVSQGAPLWNGTVIYPMPILSQPLNHGPQSISGSLDMGGYNLQNVGKFTAGQVNAVVNAALQTGSDIGAKINQSLVTCGSDCTVYVPAGSYSFSTPIVLPMNALGQFSLVLDDAASLNYSGSGCAITGTVNTSGPTVTNLRIRGGGLFGTAAAQCGIHIYPSNSVTIESMLIYGFSAGSGIWLDGANAINVNDNRILNNQSGVYATPTFCSGNVCSPGTTGSAFTPNAIWIHHNTITGNSHWGIFFNDVTTNGLTGALNNVIDSNDIEVNGSAGPTFGAVNVGRSSGLVVEGNYFEGSPRQVVLGFPGSPGAFFASLGPVIRDNYFTLLNTTPYEIELQDSNNAIIEGNATLGASIQDTGACFLNETEAIGTYFGKNHLILTTSGSSGSVAPLCQAGTPEVRLAGAGSYSAVNTNYLPFLAYQNFAITAAASDVQAAQFVFPGSACYATASGINPSQTANAQAIIAQVYVVPSNGGFTIYHPTGNAGLQYNVWCSSVPN